MNTNITWQDMLSKAGNLFTKSENDQKKATVLLWDGSKQAISEWTADSDSDVQAENLRAEMLDALGTERKGTVSKIITIAMAVKHNGLIPESHDSMRSAYNEAIRLTKTAKAHADEDHAAEEAVAALAADAPKSSSSPEGAAKIVLAKGVDEAARVLLDALGKDNEAAHKSFLRAVAQEIAGRVKPKEKPAKKAIAPKGAAKKAEPKSGAEKAKPVAAKKAAPAKPKPVARKPKAAQVEETPAPESDDLFDEFDLADNDAAPAPKTAAAPVSKPKPVRKAVRR